jgi:hypothetical protein
MVGIVVREWHAGLVVPRHNDGDVMVEYSALGDAVPPTAAGSRFDDHRSYFTMVFDHRHDLAGEDERRAAFAFMAGNLARLVQELPGVTDLRAAVTAGLFDGGFVRRGLREAQAYRRCSLLRLDAIRSYDRRITVEREGADRANTSGQPILGCPTGPAVTAVSLSS